MGSRAERFFGFRKSYWHWSSGYIFIKTHALIEVLVRLLREAFEGVPGAGWMLRGVPRGRILTHFHRVSKNPPRNRRDLGNSTLKASPERVLLNPQALRGLASKSHVSLARRISRLPGTFGACKVRCFLPLWGLLSARSWCVAQIADPCSALQAPREEGEEQRRFREHGENQRERAHVSQPGH